MTQSHQPPRRADRLHARRHRRRTARRPRPRHGGPAQHLAGRRRPARRRRLPRRRAWTCAATATPTPRSPRTATSSPARTSSRSSSTWAARPSSAATRWAPPPPRWAAAERPDLVAGLVLTGPFLRDAAAMPPRDGHHARRSCASRSPARGVPRCGRASTAPTSPAAPGRRGSTSTSRTCRAALKRPRAPALVPAPDRSSSRTRRSRPASPRSPRPAVAFVGAIDPDFKDPAAEADLAALRDRRRGHAHPGRRRTTRSTRHPRSSSPTRSRSSRAPARDATAGSVRASAVPRAGLDRAAVVDLALAVVDDGGPTGYADLTLAAVAARAGRRGARACTSTSRACPACAARSRSCASQELADVMRAVGAPLGTDAARGDGPRDARPRPRSPGRYDAVQGAGLDARPGRRTPSARPASRIVERPRPTPSPRSASRPSDRIDAVRAVRAAVHGFVVLELDGGFGMPDDVDASFAFLVDGLVGGLERLARQLTGARLVQPSSVAQPAQLAVELEGLAALVAGCRRRPRSRCAGRPTSAPRSGCTPRRRWTAGRSRRAARPRTAPARSRAARSARRRGTTSCGRRSPPGRGAPRGTA